MQHYKNLGGDSGVRAFELAAGQITVEFTTGAQYLYTVASSGASAIEEMSRLALAGHGLNSYISRFVKKNFERKLR